MLILNGCKPSNEPDNPIEETVPITQDGINSKGTVVYYTDSTKWNVYLFKQHLLYSEAVNVILPDPWHIPNREEAQILKTCTFANEERFITCDGYTFGMPSSSVSKAGAKTKYSVLGLYIKETVIYITF